MFPADIWEYPIPKIGNFSFRFFGKTLDEIHRTVSITHATPIIYAAIPRTVAIRLPTVDKDYIATSQLILLSFIDQFSFPILNHKAKVRLQFLTLAGVRFDCC